MPDLLVEKKDKIAKLTFNRPEFGNAFSLSMYTEIADTINLLGEDEEVRAIVLTGSGKHFSAGGDINRFKMLIETEQYLPPEGILAAGKMARAVRYCPKPVIAMINGAAAGAGCSLALACDFRVMDKKSKMVMSFINMGFSADTGGMYFLMRTVGAARTTELFMRGRPLDAADAYEYGICNVVAEVGELESETEKLANELANKPTQGIARQKALMNKYFYNELEEFAKDETTFMMECSRTSDHKEAVFAFLEKRKPEFTGK